MAGEIAGGIILGLLILASLFLFFIRRRRKQNRIRKGYNESYAVSRRDVFEIEPMTSVPLFQEEGDGYSHGRIAPFDPYADFPSSVTSSSFPSAADRGDDYDVSPPDSGGMFITPLGAKLQRQSRTRSGLLSADDPRYPRYSTSSASSHNVKYSYQPMWDRASVSSSARYRAPAPEEDAGPVAFPVIGEDDGDEAESRAVAGLPLPPVYSSVAGPEPRSRQQSWLADPRDEPTVPDPLGVNDSSGGGEMRRHDSA